MITLRVTELRARTSRSCMMRELASATGAAPPASRSKPKLLDHGRQALKEHRRKVKAIHEKDLRDGWGRVQMPDALDRKYPNASADRRWQWVFPHEHRRVNPKTGEQGRHHDDESIAQKAFKQAVKKAGLTKPSDVPNTEAFICHAPDRGRL